MIARSRDDNGSWTIRGRGGLILFRRESFGSALPVSLLPARSFAGHFGSECELEAGLGVIALLDLKPWAGGGGEGLIVGHGKAGEGLEGDGGCLGLGTPLGVWRAGRRRGAGCGRNFLDRLPV